MLFNFAGQKKQQRLENVSERSVGIYIAEVAFPFSSCYFQAAAAVAAVATGLDC